MANDEIQQIAQRWPNDQRVKTVQATLLAMQGEVPEAIATLDLAIRRENTNPVHYFNRALIRFQYTDQYRAVLDDCSRAESLGYQSEALAELRLEAARHLGIDSSSSGNITTPRPGLMVQYRAFWLLAPAMTKTVSLFARIPVEQFPRAAFTSLIGTLLLIGHQDQPLPMATANQTAGASDVNPSSSPHRNAALVKQWYDKAKRFEASGQIDKSLQCYANSLAANSSAAVVRFQRAQLLARSGQFHKAISDLRLLADQFPDHPKINSQLLFCERQLAGSN